MLDKKTIVRAWKDKDFRNTLSAEQLKALPVNPSGLIEITDEDLGLAIGGHPTCNVACSVGCGIVESVDICMT